ERAARDVRVARPEHSRRALREVDLAALEHAESDRPDDVHQLHLHIREAPGVAPEECGEDALEIVRRGGHPQHAGIGPAQQPCVLAQLARVVEQPTRFREEALARAREMQAPRQPVEQRDTELVLERADLARQRRLRGVQRLGCMGDGPQLRHRYESPQLPKVHRASYAETAWPKRAILYWTFPGPRMSMGTPRERRARKGKRR